MNLCKDMFAKNEQRLQHLEEQINPAANKSTQVLYLRGGGLISRVTNFTKFSSSSNEITLTATAPP